MTELLFFYHDHSAPRNLPIEQICKLPKRFDLITAQDDGWPWGRLELINPWFRILASPGLKLIDTEPFLSPLLPLVDMDLEPKTHWQFRGFFMNLEHEVMPAGFKSWWHDNTRSIPIYHMSAIPAVLKSERSHVTIA